MTINLEMQSGHNQVLYLRLKKSPYLGVTMFKFRPSRGLSSVNKFHVAAQSAIVLKSSSTPL